MLELPPFDWNEWVCQGGYLGLRHVLPRLKTEVRHTPLIYPVIRITIYLVLIFAYTAPERLLSESTTLYQAPICSPLPLNRDSLLRSVCFLANTPGSNSPIFPSAALFHFAFLIFDHYTASDGTCSRRDGCNLA
jgi:hypothetical protein